MDAVRPAWASEDYATLAQRVKHLNTIYGLVAGVIEERTTDEWLELFQRLDIPASPIRTPAELFNNAHLQSAGFFETVESPYGPVRFPGVPTWFSRTPGAVAGAAPALGAHTDEVLKELAHPTGAVDAAPGST
jgi:crotonobetainyl-CoA:carnitine CoA-transferase CaiB-like acyl-CoA transferase